MRDSLIFYAVVLVGPGVQDSLLSLHVQLDLGKEVYDTSALF